MATNILLPILGESISEAVLVRWLKQAGDPVRRGEVVAELETDKSSLELESPANGILREILAEAGARITTGQLLAVVAGPGEVLSPPGSVSPAAAIPEGKTASDTGPLPSGLAAAPRSDRRISPAARKLAQELGIDLSQVEPGAPGARVSTEDVQRYAAAQSSAPRAADRMPSHRVEMSEVRRATARRMTESAQTIPQFSIGIDVEMDHSLRLLEEIRSRTVPAVGKISLTAWLAYLLGRVLPKHPRVNARYDPEGIEVFDTVNLAVAVAAPRGLFAPVLPHVESLSLLAIARRLADLAGRANQGTLTSSDLSGGTFTLSNLGMYGVTQFIPLINPPQAAILGVGAARPAVLPQGESGTRSVSLLSLSLSADHRVLDGVEAAAFLTGLKDELERFPLDQIHIETPEE